MTDFDSGLVFGAVAALAAYWVGGLVADIVVRFRNRRK